MKNYIKYISLLLTIILIASSGINICANYLSDQLAASSINSWGARVDGKLDRIYECKLPLSDGAFSELDSVGAAYFVHDYDSLYVFVSLDCKRANLSSEQCEKTITVAIDWENKGESASYYTVCYPDASLNDLDFEYAICDSDGKFNVEYKIPLQCNVDADIGFDVELKYINAHGENISVNMLDTSFGYDISKPSYFDYLSLMTPMLSIEDPYFLDVTGHWYNEKREGYPWYYDSVKYCFRNSLMVGVDDSYFAPNAEMSRAMLVQVLYNMESKSDISAYENKFTDVKEEDWFCDAVLWASNNGIASGTDDTTFSPNEPVTREQLSAMVYRYANAKNYDVTASADMSRFKDTAGASLYAQNALKWSVGSGLISGNKINGETLLDPKGNATRAQVAMILENFCEKISK